MKLLITGGCGFLGSNLAADAIARNDDLLVFDNLNRNGSKENLLWLQSLGKFEFKHGDIRNQDDIHGAIKAFGPDVVFHLAGQVAMTTSIENPRLDFEINVMGTFNLLEAVRIYCPEAVVIYSSSNKVYGDLDQYSYIESETRYECLEKPEGFDESTPLNFQSPYGCSKGAADQYMLDYAQIFGLKTVVFRHSSMYGGRQFSTFDQGWIGWFCLKAVEKQSLKTKTPFTISGNGKQVRDVLHASDMQSLYMAAVNNIGLVAGRALNIGGGVANSLSLLELFNLLESLLSVRLDYVQISPRLSDQKIFVADIGLAKELIGWEPKISVVDGINSMLDWSKNL
jgi:CDP-paratose 2-epimerase